MRKILMIKAMLASLCLVALLLIFNSGTADEWKKFGPVSDFYPWPFEQSTHVDDLKFFPIRQEGELNACGLEFTIASRDWAYRDNMPFMAVGSATLYAFPHWKGVTALALKLTVVDVEPRADALWGRRSSVASAYVSMGSDEANSLVLAPHTAETESEPGSQSFLAWEPEVLSLVTNLLETTVIRVWFNREKGKVDLELPIHLSDFEDQRQAFRMCLFEVTGRVIRDIAEEMDIELPPR